MLVTLVTVAPELLPVLPMRLTLFYFYYAVKVISFLSLGFLAPLVFRSLNGIGIGLLLSFLSALVIETCQGLLHNGHTFHVYELAGKLVLIAAGFALALDCRYESRILLGPLQINLVRNDG